MSPAAAGRAPATSAAGHGCSLACSREVFQKGPIPAQSFRSSSVSVPFVDFFELCASTDGVVASHSVAASRRSADRRETSAADNHRRAEAARGGAAPVAWRRGCRYLRIRRRKCATC